MIRHCVFIRFRPAISAAHKAKLFCDIAALKDRLPGILDVHAGSNVSPEAGMDKGYGDGFIVDFADAAARDAYLEDPQHKQAGARLVAAAEGGVGGILVFDINV